ncbi:MAG: zinc ribbon domain-containing protein [Firmicutes bacterium]|nr:zinc ribbon domain-containing protein [Bacillota bacterium]
MANFCTQCGAKLTPEQKFCTQCGAKVFIEEETAPEISAPEITETPVEEIKEVEDVKEDVKEEITEEVTEETKEAAAEEVTKEVKEETAETSVPPVEEQKEEITEDKKEDIIKEKEEKEETAESTVEEAVEEKTETVEETAEEKAEPVEDTVIAVKDKGESAIGQLGDPTAYMNAKFPDSLINALKAFGNGIGNAFKDPKIIITVAVILMAQLFVRVLQFFNLGGRFTYFLSVLTFSRFGMGRTIFGKIGGVFGECALMTAVVSLFGGGINDAVLGCKSLFRKGEKRYAPAIFFGAVVSLLLVSFFVGHENLTKVLCALASLLLALEITGRKQGVVFDLIASLMPKRSESVLNGFMTGMCIGCAASAVYCLAGCGYIAVFFAFALMFAGIVLLVVLNNTKPKDGESQ